MKKIFLFIISISMLTLVGCQKEEATVIPTTSSSTPVFKYDNTTVEAVLEAAGYKPEEVTFTDKSFGVWGLYEGVDENGWIMCRNHEYLCFVVIEPKGKRISKDIIIAKPELPVVIKGDYKLISDENGTKKYQIITNN